MMIPGFLKKYIKLQITKEQCKDTGLAFTLIILIIGYFTQNSQFYGIAIPVMLVTMIWPLLLRPVGIFWFSFAAFTGNIISWIILTVIYTLLVIPVGLFRKSIGIDNLKLKCFKKDNRSVLINRDHIYNKSDFEKPY